MGFATRAAAIGLVTIASLIAPIGAQLPPQQPGTPADFADFDIRRGESAAAAATLRRLASTAANIRADAERVQAAGVARLRADVAGLVVENIPELGTPEVIGVRPGAGFLTPPSNDRVESLRRFVATYADALGMAQDQVTALELIADYENPAGNLAWVEFEQRINGLPVFLGTIRGAFTARGELAQTTGQLAPFMNPGLLATAPSLSAAQAVTAAAAAVGWQVDASQSSERSRTDGRITLANPGMADDATARLLYFPLEAGAARLAWSTEIWGPDRAYMVVVDAADGTLLFRKNLTASQTQSATYNVYTSDSPAPMSPSTAVPGFNVQAPYVTRTSVTLIGNEHPNTFNNLGWMTDGVNVTDGNNVEAGIDVNGVDGVDAPVTGASRVFNFSYSPQTDAPSNADYRNGEVTDAFYWTNRYHDSLYLLGFTEAARNFQHDNFGRGGLPGDRVSAQLQDSSATSNAHFTTPADGARPKMQMYVWTGPTPDRSGGLEHDVLLHELTHGTSSRLHGNAAGLSTTMSRGMGEGWSDFYARALLATSDEDNNGAFTLGGWVTHLLAAGYTDNYYYGIRRFPYAVISAVGGPASRPHNPLTFADIDAAQFNIGNGAYSPNPAITNAAFSVHGVGEVWASMLFEVRARFIARLGFAVGNQRILQFVTDAMKLEPVSPTFLQGRDAIIAAANAGGGTEADLVDIRAGFAARGLGISAEITFLSSTSASVVEAFDYTQAIITISDVSVTEGNAGTSNANFTVSLSQPASDPVSVDFATANGSAAAPLTTTSFSNNAAITIPASGAAAPYPSTITVGAGLGLVTGVTLTLTGLSHSYLSDVDVLLVSPAGQRVVVLSDVGTGANVTGLTLTLDDGAVSFLTSAAPASGTYKATNLNQEAIETWPSPAPAPTRGGLAAFNGFDPAGEWRLFVADDEGGDAGSISGGWSLSITTGAPGGDFVAKAGTLTFTAGQSSQPVVVVVNGDTSFEPNETFTLNLGNPVGGEIGDPQGMATILNDDGPPFTDATIMAGVTVIKAIHVTELRSRINAVRVARGLGEFAFTDAALSPGSSVIRAVHITEMRAALNQAYTAAGMTPPTYSAPTPAIGVTVLRIAITELRSAVTAIE